MPPALEGPNSSHVRCGSTLSGSAPCLSAPTVGCTHGYSRSSPAGLPACQITCPVRTDMRPRRFLAARLTFRAASMKTFCAAQHESFGQISHQHAAGPPPGAQRSRAFADGSLSGPAKPGDRTVGSCNHTVEAFRHTAGRSHRAAKPSGHTVESPHHAAEPSGHASGPPGGARASFHHTEKPANHTGESFHRTAESFYRTGKPFYRATTRQNLPLLPLFRPF